MGKQFGTPTHGYSTGGPSRTYTSWVQMWQRCANPKAPNFPRYGGKGIMVCPRWWEFENFLADMGDRPEGKSLDRFPDKNGNYGPGNCRWATAKEQSANRNPSPKRKPLITFNGESHSLADWGLVLGGKRSFIANRLNRGMSVEQALATPRLKQRYR